VSFGTLDSGNTAMAWKGVDEGVDEGDGGSSDIRLD
jgi:hypothetical protein